MILLQRLRVVRHAARVFPSSVPAVGTGTASSLDDHQVPLRVGAPYNLPREAALVFFCVLRRICVRAPCKLSPAAAAIGGSVTPTHPRTFKFGSTSIPLLFQLARK